MNEEGSQHDPGEFMFFVVIGLGMLFAIVKLVAYMNGMGG